MMKSSVRGMAKVSVVWTIVMLVVAMVFAVMFFLTGGELENQRLLVANGKKELAEREAQIKKDVTEQVALSELLGYYDVAKGERTDFATLKAGFDSLKAAIPDIDPSAKTFQAAMPFVINAVKTQKDRVADLDAQLRGKVGELEQLNRQMREMGDKNAKDLADAASKLADSEAQKSDLQQGYEKQLAEYKEQLRSANVKVAEANTKADADGRKFAEEAGKMRTIMAEQGRKLNPFVKEPQAVDGKVLSVSKDLGLGWINLGAKNRLPVGTKFNVLSGTPGSTRLKAMAEVTKVEGDMAEVMFTEQRDPFDPPTTGDAVSNPVYDPRGDRSALLLGGFSGKYGEDQLKNLLASMGVTVQKQLDASTDFLIVGSEMFVDENKQPVETPIQPTDLPVYKEAVAQGVQIVLLKDLRNYFRF